MSLRLCLLSLGTLLTGCADSEEDRRADTRSVDSLNAIGASPGDSAAHSTGLAPGAQLGPGGVLAPGGTLAPEIGLAP